MTSRTATIARTSTLAPASERLGPASSRPAPASEGFALASEKLAPASEIGPGFSPDMKAQSKKWALALGTPFSLTLASLLALSLIPASAQAPPAAPSATAPPAAAAPAPVAAADNMGAATAPVLPNFKVFQFPPDQIPRIDGKDDDWAIVPDSYAITLADIDRKSTRLNSSHLG